jgi:hypothetical protein
MFSSSSRIVDVVPHRTGTPLALLNADSFGIDMRLLLEERSLTTACANHFNVLKWRTSTTRTSCQLNYPCLHPVLTSCSSYFHHWSGHSCQLLHPQGTQPASAAPETPPQRITSPPPATDAPPALTTSQQGCTPPQAPAPPVKGLATQGTTSS